MPCTGTGVGYDGNRHHGGDTGGIGSPLANAGETGALGMPFQWEPFFESQ